VCGNVYPILGESGYWSLREVVPIRPVLLISCSFISHPISHSFNLSTLNMEATYSSKRDYRPLLSLKPLNGWFSQWRPGFSHKIAQVGFVTNRLTVEQAITQSLTCPWQSSSKWCFKSHPSSSVCCSRYAWVLVVRDWVSVYLENIDKWICHSARLLVPERCVEVLRRAAW
jgi:hypothetical protein